MKSITTNEVGGLPVNVQSRNPLRIATSAIATAGLGIISEKRVQANKEIFRIPQPLACQVKAWKSHHKAECKIYASNRGDEIPHTLRATIRLLNWRLGGHLTDDEFTSLLSLRGHKDWWKTIDNGVFWSIVEEECKNIKDWTHTVLEEDVIEDVFCIFVNNSMSIHSPEGREVIGSCLDPFSAIINHSCDPNSFVFFEGQDLRARSIRAIAPGEEITISYVAPNESFDVRQEQLASKHCFTCTCKKCEKGPCWPGDLITGDDAVDKSIQEAQNQLRAFLQQKAGSQPVGAIESVVHRICAEGYPGKPWPGEISPMPDTHFTLSNLYQQIEDWPKAFAFHLIISFGIDPVIWPSQYNLHRVHNFMNYVRIETQITNIISEGDPRAAMLQPLKGEILRLQYPHGKRYAEDATKAFGKDSIMAEAANAWAAQIDMTFAGQGNMAAAIASYYATKEGKADMGALEEKLLKWARTFVR